MSRHLAGPVFAAEREAGLGDEVAFGRVTLAAAPRLLPVPELSKASRDLVLGQANPHQPDLYYLEMVLATAGLEIDPARGLPAGLNLNEDFFDGVEAYLARHTPEDKQVNYEHDCADIIGHITSNRAVSKDGVLPDDLVVEQLPGRFDVVAASVLYKFWPRPELQARMDSVIAEIQRGEWFVSMEAYFRGFDYLVMDAQGCRVVARDEKTAHLTKHLRAYKGTGSFGGARVARVLRNITFSGQGLVRQPANPGSVILTPQAQAQKTTPASAAGYSPASDQKGRETKMSEIETLQKALDTAKAEADALRTQLSETSTKQVAAAKEKAEAELAEARKQLAEATKAADAAKASLAEMTASLEAARKEASDAAVELAGLKASVTRANRIAAAKDKLRLDDAKAAEFVDSASASTDEQFAKQVEIIAASLPPAATLLQTEPGNTTHPAGPAGPAPKSTPAPLPPKSTPAPVVAAKILDSAVAVPTPALATPGVEGDAVATRRLAIAKLFGYKEPAKS